MERSALGHSCALHFSGCIPEPGHERHARSTPVCLRPAFSRLVMIGMYDHVGACLHASIPQPGGDRYARLRGVGPTRQHSSAWW
ncbi:hypothetical protein CALVIDRAFT_541454 [Calocera viscosa TUFC12733]|uniref:Uncharacterized protein n=1 Tax=Calocera viscosa (strain TUFC12733) TaxID=1330018 RepID=A0A167HTM1_CALVF|nr:hypothetical protein CALVIDRAFT_541454 [Calocera viscosa TUFC12733]